MRCCMLLQVLCVAQRPDLLTVLLPVLPPAGLICFRRGAVVGRSYLGIFGPPGEILEEEVRVLRWWRGGHDSGGNCGAVAGVCGQQWSGAAMWRWQACLKNFWSRIAARVMRGTEASDGMQRCTHGGAYAKEFSHRHKAILLSPQHLPYRFCCPCRWWHTCGDCRS